MRSSKQREGMIDALKKGNSASNLEFDIDLNERSDLSLEDEPYFGAGLREPNIANRATETQKTIAKQMTASPIKTQKDVSRPQSEMLITKSDAELSKLDKLIQEYRRENQACS